MTTIVNNPGATADTGGTSFLIGAVVLVAFVMVLVYFGIPAIRRMGPVQLTIPATQVVIPDKVNVNVTQSK